MSYIAVDMSSDTTPAVPVNHSVDGMQEDVQHPQPAFMERAIELSRVAGIEKRTGGCFGAVVVKDGKVVGEGYNNVMSQNDPTWYGRQ